MRVRLRNRDREVTLTWGRTIHTVLGELQIDPDHDADGETVRDLSDEVMSVEIYRGAGR